MVDYGCPSSWLSEVDHDHGWLWLIRVYYGWTCPCLTFVDHVDLIMVGHVDYVHRSLLWHYCIVMLIIFCSSNCDILLFSSHGNIYLCLSHCEISLCSSHVDIRFCSSHCDISFCSSLDIVRLWSSNYDEGLCFSQYGIGISLS